jgi:hypothetical protein
MAALKITDASHTPGYRRGLHLLMVYFYSIHIEPFERVLDRDYPAQRYDRSTTTPRADGLLICPSDCGTTLVRARKPRAQ